MVCGDNGPSIETCCMRLAYYYRFDGMLIFILHMNVFLYCRSTYKSSLHLDIDFFFPSKFIHVKCKEMNYIYMNSLYYVYNTDIIKEFLYIYFVSTLNSMLH